MTLEEMKTELEKNGYRVIKIGGQAKWAQTVWKALWRYSSTKIFPKQGIFDNGTISCGGRMERVRNYVRQQVKKKYGYASLGIIPEDMISEVVSFMVKIGIEKIDQMEKES